MRILIVAALVLPLGALAQAVITGKQATPASTATVVPPTAAPVPAAALTTGQAPVDPTKALPALPPPAGPGAAAGPTVISPLDAARGSLPLSPGDITTLHREIDDRAKAAATDPRSPPKLATTAVAVDLSPGAPPLVVRVGQGTSMIFLDVGSNPWPIKTVVNHNPGILVVNIPVEGGNALSLTPQSTYSRAMVEVHLEGLATPLMITAMMGQTTVDLRRDFLVPLKGPKSSTGMVARGADAPALVRDEMVTLLDGLPVPGGRALKSEGADARVWMHNGRMLVRTALVPRFAWQRMVRSSDGMGVYEVVPSSLLSLATQNGEVVMLKVEVQ